MIRKIKWKNHNILGNLELDFTKNDGGIYQTIVIVGENGSGKTTILQTLANFLNLHSMLPFEYIEYAIAGKLYKIYYDDEQDGLMGFHIRQELPGGITQKIRRNSNNNRQGIEKDKADIRQGGVVFSTARSGFKTSQVKGTSTQQIDSDKYNIDDNDDFTSIKQLLVDLDTQDNSEWMEMTKKQKVGLSYANFEDFTKNKAKLTRFRKAFDGFFEDIHFKKISSENPNEKEVLFEKFGKTISVDNLSTGEKQIVFRGTYLLRNIKALSCGEILIDEPELSMHPRWQEKILDFYRNLFENTENQIILTTHSEYVLRSALKDKNNVLVIIVENDGEKISNRKVTAPNVLPSITFAETNFLAFGVYSVDYHIELYGYLQNKYNLTTIKDCDTYIKKSNLYDPLLHKKSSSYGTTSYETLCTYIRNAIHHPDNGNTFKNEELKKSIDLLIKLCK